SRLPEHYRAVVVLCHCEGRTRDEAAQQLGCKPGTVKIRLERARALLRARLARRGLGLTAALALLNPPVQAVPLAFLGTTVTAAGLFALGESTAAVSQPAATLAEGVLKTMLLNRLKGAVLLTLSLLLLGSGAALSVWAHKPVQAPVDAFQAL